jgi:hypothetical protein
MTPRAAGLLGAAAFAGGVILAGGVLAARDGLRPLPGSRDRLLYLTSGSAAQRLFLSFDALAADLYWIRTVQHYGGDRRSARTSDRFALLEPLLELTTTLDPHFNIAYRFGAIFLAMEAPDGPNRPERAIDLLLKGLAHNPSRWQYAHDIAFIHYWYGRNYREASEWFTRAAAIPGAPSWLEPLAAVTLAEGGDRAGARQILEELERSDHEYIRRAGQRGLAQLRALDEIDGLQSMLDGFHSATKRYPAGWSEIVRAGRLRAVPLDPTGTPYVYDPDTHKVTLSAASPLFPLPRPFAHK